MEKQPKIWIYTLCYNEMKIMPLVLKYWERYADRVVVYDTGSTDGSAEELKKHDWIEVRKSGQPYGIDDRMYQNLKNHCWKEVRYTGVDLVQVSDFDEVLWADDLKTELADFNDSTGTIWKPNGYFLATKAFPASADILCHDQPDAVCARDNLMQKCVLFKPNEIAEMQYGPGAHQCAPLGNVAMYDNRNIKLLHLGHLGLDFMVDKYRSRSARLSRVNKLNGWGFHYNLGEDEIRKDFDSRYAAGIRIKSKGVE